MGAERWLRFVSTKEANRCRDSLVTILPPPVGGLNYSFLGVEEKYGCYIEWHSPTVLWIGYQMHDLSATFASLVSREVAKRFRLRAIGADSVGWYKEPPPEQRQAPTWAVWLAGFTIEKDVRWFEDTDPEIWAGMEQLVTRTFQKLDPPAWTTPAKALEEMMQAEDQRFMQGVQDATAT